MATEFRSGKMVASTRVIGKKISSLVEVGTTFQMAMSTKGSGKTTCHMALAHTSTKMGQLTLVNGTRTSNTELEKKFFLTRLLT